MYFEFIYKTGRKIPLLPAGKKANEKLALVEFPYTATEVLSGTALFVVVFIILGLIGFLILDVVGYALLFLGLAIGASAYLYATSISRTQLLIEFRGEMLQALLEISNYISLNMSLEGAIMQTSKDITGTLGKQLTEIKRKLSDKEYTTIGDAFHEYIPIWLKINPEFVKGINQLQTAAQSLPEEREVIINEVIETVIQSYYDSSKHFTEELSSKTKSLIGAGVMLPMMSLILLPLISIFMTDFITAPLLIFLYVLFFPTILLLMSMNFATNRIQVNTIELTLSPRFKKLPIYVPIVCVIIAIMFLIPSAMHLLTINMETSIRAAREFKIESVFLVWLGLFGMALATTVYCYFYAKQNEKLWHEMDETEQDLPHLLQLLASYLSLNRSFESILPEIEDDYKKHGFEDHPVTHMIHEITTTLQNTKKSLSDIMEKDLPKIVSSKRIVEVFRRIVLFADIDQKSAAKSSRMIRAQTISVYKLDGYIRTLLAETSSTVSMTITVLAPLLATTATIMASAIVMSLEFIKQQIGRVLKSFGGGELKLELVDVKKVIPPTVLEFIVGIYFLETLIILAVFLSNVNFGTDKFKIAETISKTVIVAFLIYSAVLFAGHYLFTEVVFKGVLT